MISRFLKRKSAVVPPAAPCVPQGMIIWAIGDVHGRLDLLEPLVGAIVEEADRSPADRTMVVFLGDYIDRGPDSRGVMRCLASIADRQPGIEWRFLKGNHEDTMIKFLSDPKIGQQWCEYGGEATLASYGLRLPHIRHKVEAWAHVATDLEHRMDPAELAFLDRLELSVTIGDYFFAHAGARPGEPLERQSAEDLMWIRGSFIDSPVGFERVIVHGHTPEAEVYSDHRRVGIDTKAYASGVLTALRLYGPERVLLQAVSERSEDPPSAGTASVSIRRTEAGAIAGSRRAEA